MKQKIVSFIKILTCAALLFGATAIAQAQDKKADGTWKWTMPGRNGGPDRTNTLTLKVEGEKLTGNISSPGRNGVTETAISDGTIKDGALAFSVTREFNGNKMVIKYSGKVEGDTIKGKAESERNGQANSRDWEAKRQ